jgi:hypothetical protein
MEDANFFICSRPIKKWFSISKFYGLGCKHRTLLFQPEGTSDRYKRVVLADPNEISNIGNMYSLLSQTSTVPHCGGKIHWVLICGIF